MKKKGFKDGLVYSTNSDLMQQMASQEECEIVETLSPQNQKLKVYLDTKTNPGKKITIVENFVGKKEDLEILAKKLKVQFGVGGSVQDNQIWLQGDMVIKVKEWLQKNDYGLKK